MISRRRRIVVALAVAAALGGCATRPAPSPSIALPLPTASLGPGGVPSGPNPWILSGRGDGGHPTTFDDVLAIDDGFVIVGGSGPARDHPIALHSTDGISWMAEPIPAHPGMRPYQLTSWGDRIVALGAGRPPDCPEPFALDLWVREPDGTWTEQWPDPALCDLGSASVVVFRDRPWLVGDGHGDQPVLMERGNDGSMWNDRHGILGNVMVDAAAADASGMWILARTREGSPLTIHSRDGVTWTTEPLRAANGGPIQVNVTATLGDALLVIASNSEGGVRLVRAPGGGWAETPTTGLPNPRSAPDFEAVSGGAGSLIAISSGFSLELGGLWVSPDGVAWHQLPMPPQVEATVSAAAVRGDRVILVGSAKMPAGSGTVTRDPVSAIWTAQSSILAP